MKQCLLIFLCVLVFCANCHAKGSFHTIEGKVKSVEIGEQKIVIVMSGTIELSMFKAGGNGFQSVTTILDNVPVTYLRRPGSADSEAYWVKNSAALRDSVGKTVKIICPAPSYTFTHDRITSLSAEVLWIVKGDGSIL